MDKIIPNKSAWLIENVVSTQKNKKIANFVIINYLSVLPNNKHQFYFLYDA